MGIIFARRPGSEGRGPGGGDRERGRFELKLADLLNYDEIIIQCHDNPDADAIASGFALWEFLDSRGKHPHLVYGGDRPISKPDVKLMCDLCRIHLNYLPEFRKSRRAPKTPELLITVDCQPGNSNVAALEAKQTAVIDHHKVFDPARQTPLWEIRDYNACCTIVWDMLREAGCASLTRELSTALYFGLYMDTVYFQDLSHPVDLEMKNALEFDRTIFDQLKSSNLSLDDLIICGQALSNPHYSAEYRFAVAEAPSCDPNLLGVISDMMMGVQSVDVCISYCLLPKYAKISVRSHEPNIPADQLAEWVSRDIGEYGGRGENVAGGKLFRKELEQICRSDTWDGLSGAAGRLIYSRITSYYEALLRLGVGEFRSEEKGGTENLFELLARRAELGEPQSQYRLGTLYAQGREVPQDWTRAAALYAQAAEGGNAAAQHSLGLCYAYGRGVNRDWAQAFRLYAQAAEQNYAAAQKELGVCYAKGRGVSQDWRLAAVWYRRAAENGNAQAQYNLAQRYYRGEGVEQSLTLAASWFGKAARQGYGWAQYRLGKCYARGDGVSQDWKEAFYWYEQAAEQGVQEARARLIDCLENGRPGVPRDPARAAYWRGLRQKP